ncbi:mitochondrial ribosomal protein S17 [Oratosquilla oratoria]|uniref:mitochondrial ribosomal protein S17 n=1 Tax=Oratosquilla oratoria TaxID=337810 RepID=UPI003F76A584
MASAIGRNFMLIGQCIAHEISNAARVKVKRPILDKNLLMYVSKHEKFYAHDPEGICKVGDIVLIKALPNKLTRQITHELVKIVHPYGDITDPITGKKCVVGNFRENVKLRNEMFGKNEEGGFDYEKAPDRGWQEGKKDFTHKIGYQKWHEFEPGHPLHDDKAAS